MFGLLILLAAGSFTISMVMTVLMKRVSRLVGLVDHPGARKVHVEPTPNGGGVAIFVATWAPVALAVAACACLVHGNGALPLLPGLDVYATGVLTMLPRLTILFIGAVIIWTLGLADDRWNLSPWLRLAVQIGVALFLVFKGMTVSIFVGNAWIRGTVTILWVVGLINAFNMLDNMDGLSAGVGLIISIFFSIVAIQTQQYFIAAFLCCMAGALGGFLVYNFSPARIFMGDSGGTLLGYLLAVMTIQFTFYQPERPYFPLVVPLLIFGLPLFDTITVVWIRLRSGRSPFQGDTNHFSHRLVALGMTKRNAVLTIYLVTATVALGATALFYANSNAVLVILAQTIALFTLIGILERVRPSKAAENNSPDSSSSEG